MITTENMTVEDFLSVMGLNADVYPEFAELLDEQKKYLANVNIATGTAQSFFEDGKLVAVGGIRCVGVGEAWMISSPQIRDNRGLSLLKETRRNFIETRDKHNLWRVFAESKISETFLKHLGFEAHPQGFVWTRT